MSLVEVFNLPPHSVAAQGPALGCRPSHVEDMDLHAEKCAGPDGHDQ